VCSVMSVAFATRVQLLLPRQRARSRSVRPSWLLRAAGEHAEGSRARARARGLDGVVPDGRHALRARAIAVADPSAAWADDREGSPLPAAVRVGRCCPFFGHARDLVPGCAGVRPFIEATDRVGPRQPRYRARRARRVDCGQPPRRHNHRASRSARLQSITQRLLSGAERHASTTITAAATLNPITDLRSVQLQFDCESPAVYFLSGPHRRLLVHAAYFCLHCERSQLLPARERRSCGTLPWSAELGCVARAA
jgi:hypothetical protein